MKPSLEHLGNRSLFLSVVMPTHNEEGSVESVIQEHVAILSQLPEAVTDWEIVVVDDGSDDDTPEILDRLAARLPRLRVVKHPVNQGLFRAFDDAHRAAKGTHVFATASDGQWPAANLVRMLERMLQTDADLVVGVRPHREEVYTPWRRFVSHCYQLLPRLLFGVQTQDAGSVKLGRRELFQCKFISHSPFVEAERIIRALRAGCRVEFVPIEFLPRSSGKAGGAKLSYIIASLRDSLRCFWTYRLRRTNQNPIYTRADDHDESSLP